MSAPLPMHATMPVPAKFPEIAGVIWEDFDSGYPFDPSKVHFFKPFPAGAIVLGAEFGDEGKGKKVDALAEFFKKLGYLVLSIRGQGSGNAGHTVKFGEEEQHFHYLTSAGNLADAILLAPGMLIDPIRLLEEMKQLPRDKREIVMIAERATIVCDLHRVWDAWCEMHRNGNDKIGTTGSGVGPCAGGRAFRSHVTYGDALKCRSAEELRELFLSDPIIPEDVKNAKRKDELGQELTELVFSLEYVKELFKAIHKLKIVNSVEIVDQYRFEGNWAVLAEVSQAVGLDTLFGNSGHKVTSTHCTSSGAIAGCGLTIYDFPQGITQMAKGYTSKVGGGEFPTEFDLTNPVEKRIDEFIHNLVGEFGVTTHRRRKLGWFDAVLVRYSIQLNGGCVSVNCMDVIGKLREVTDYLKVCFAYRNKITGEVTYTWPYHLCDYEPLYITYSLRNESGRLKSEKTIIREYIELIEWAIGQTISEYGVGPKREDFLPRDAAFVA